MKPRILFLSTELPWPVDGGGKLRTFETLACLLRFAEVRLLSVSEGEDPGGEALALEEALPGLVAEAPIPHPVRIRRRPIALARTALIQLSQGQPYLVAKFRSAAYLAAAGAIARAFRPDVVWCDHLNVFPAAEAIAETSGAKLILDQHNVESDLFRKAAGAGGVLRHIAKFEGERAARYESEALRRADRVIAISEGDASRFEEMGAGEKVVTVLPSMGELGPCPSPPAPTEQLAFLGTLSWPPNAEGVRWLASEVMPALRTHLPGARAVVGGRGLSPSLAKEAEAAGVEVRGWVEDPREFMRAAGTVVVPILSGSGISMKLLDAMRAGVPIASTPAGARGLGVRDGEELLLEAGAEGLARALARLVRDPGLRERLVLGAWSYLEEHHGRAALSRRYEGVVEAAKTAPRRRASGARR